MICQEKRVSEEYIIEEINVFRGESRMSLNEEFMQRLLVEIKNHHHNLLILRECLVEFKNTGMDKDSMIKSLEELRNGNDPETEDILLELMDFVVGYCNPNLAIF